MNKHIHVFTNAAGDNYTASRWQNYGKSRIYIYKNGSEFGYFDENGVLHGKGGGRIKGTHFGSMEMSHADFLARFEILESSGEMSHKPEQQLTREAIAVERRGMTEDNDLDEQFWKRDA